MSELITLNQAINVDPGAVTWTVGSIHLSRENAFILVSLRETDGTGSLMEGGRRHDVRIDGQEAISLIAALNKADLRTNTLLKRILAYLTANGYLGSGTISGDPE